MTKAADLMYTVFCLRLKLEIFLLFRQAGLALPGGVRQADSDNPLSVKKPV